MRNPIGQTFTTEVIPMKKNNYKTVQLDKGKVHIYDFGTARLHAYQTNDFLSDEVFILEKGGKAVVIEAPCFTDNIRELTEYIAKLDTAVEGKLLSYHMAGGTFLPDVPVYATKNADDYGHQGGGKGLIDNFSNTFGDIFDASIPTVTTYIDEGSVTIAGITMNIVMTADAFDIEISEINTVYTHMLGNDCHSIVAGSGHADTIIEQLRGYIATGYDLILSSHYTPEDLKDAQTKIDYLEELKEIAVESANAQAFKLKVQQRYPSYGGENYLDMTAGFFFPAE